MATYAEGQNNAIPFITQLLEKDESNLFTNTTLNIIYQEATFNSKTFHFFTGDGYSVKACSLIDYISETHVNPNTIYLDIICQNLESLWIKLDV